MFDDDPKPTDTTKLTLTDEAYEAGAWNDAGLFCASGGGGNAERPASCDVPDEPRDRFPLLGDIGFSCTVGEVRRALALFVAREIAPSLFDVRARSVRVIGGHDLLRAPVAIPGRFASLDAAWAAGSAWATAVNEVA